MTTSKKVSNSAKPVNTPKIVETPINESDNKLIDNMDSKAVLAKAKAKAVKVTEIIKGEKTEPVVITQPIIVNDTADQTTPETPPTPPEIITPQVIIFNKKLNPKEIADNVNVALDDEANYPKVTELVNDPNIDLHLYKAIEANMINRTINLYNAPESTTALMDAIALKRFRKYGSTKFYNFFNKSIHTLSIECLNILLGENLDLKYQEHLGYMLNKYFNSQPSDITTAIIEKDGIKYKTTTITEVIIDFDINKLKIVLSNSSAVSSTNLKMAYDKKNKELFTLLSNSFTKTYLGVKHFDKEYQDIFFSSNDNVKVV